MSLILRWFEDDGERHRAFFRQHEASGRRELVIAGRDWQHATPEVGVSRLEDLSEDALVELARTLRSQNMKPSRERAV
jgi:hypothetical protein